MDASIRAYTLHDLKKRECYLRQDCVVFRKTKEAFGGLSNMAAGYPIEVIGRKLFTSEALYQCCRYPHKPEVQEEIAKAHSPMHAKMISKRYRHLSRKDWEDEVVIQGELSQVRIEFMRWCLLLKLVNTEENFERFGQLLLDTGSKDIVEESIRDDFWGAKPREDGLLEGSNALGKLLMELRDALRNGFFSEPHIIDLPASIKVHEGSEFRLFGVSVEPIIFEPKSRGQKVQVTEIPQADTYRTSESGSKGKKSGAKITEQLVLWDEGSE
ncbi:MAG: NADAR family protein [Candidatus Methanomethyliaceae archaeon]